ncbi:MAG: glycosyltransferase [Halobacteriota archaeon]|jgi:glycosyltransferase involved in cell wall biosynthesis
MLSVVIPAHNEADHIRGLLEAFSVFSGVELIVAEDASTDGTQNIVQEFAGRNNDVVLSSCDKLTGKGAAVKRGLKLAKGDVLGFIDGDGSIHPKELMRVAATIDDGADLAVGSRDLRTSVIVRPQPLSRRVSGSIYSLLARALLDTHIKDFQCGCKVFRRDVWHSLTIACDGFAFDTELIAKAHEKGFVIIEVPITWSNQSNSKVRISRDVLPMLKCILKTRAQIRE